jgi:hypothetical protein
MDSLLSSWPVFLKGQQRATMTTAGLLPHTSLGCRAWRGWGRQVLPPAEFLLQEPRAAVDGRLVSGHAPRHHLHQNAPN